MHRMRKHSDRVNIQVMNIHPVTSHLLLNA